MKRTLILTALLLPALLPAGAQQPWSLEKCIRHAIDNNLTLRQQEAARQQSEVELNTARWSRLPQVSADAGYSFHFGRSLQANNTYQSVNTQNTSMNLGTSVPLFTGMQIPNNIALARLNLKAATEDLNKAREDISIQVASAYLQVLFNEELTDVARQQLELSRLLLQQKETFYNNGKASEAEWREAQARVAQDQLSAVQADNNRQLALLDLSQLLELPSPDSLSVVAPEGDPQKYFSSIAAPAVVYNDALLNKPAIKAAQYRLEGADHSIRIAQSGYYPKLSLSAGLGTSYYNTSKGYSPAFGSQLRDNFSQYVGLQLSIPIFNRLATRNQVRSARIQRFNLEWQLEDSKKKLYKEIQQAYYNAVGAAARYESSVTADQAAEASFLLMKEKYNEGKANATEYNESRTGWMKAVSERIQAKYDYIFRTKILDFYRGIPLTLD